MKKIIARVKCLFGYHVNPIVKLELGDGINMPKHVYTKKLVCPICNRILS